MPLEEVVGSSAIDDARLTFDKVHADADHFGPLLLEATSPSDIGFDVDDDTLSMRPNTPNSMYDDLHFDIYSVQREKCRKSWDADTLAGAEESDGSTTSSEFSHYTVTGPSDITLAISNMEAVAYRRLAVTQEGVKCFVPYTAQAGDKVAMVNRARSPLILRNAWDNRYRLVGAALVEGVQHGRLISCTEEETVELVLI